MTNTPNSEDRVGWEHIWRSGDIPPRYRSFAPPNPTVVEWADTLPPAGHILDLGCGVGRHCVYLGGRGFRMAGLDISPTGIKQTQAVCAERGIAFEGHVSNMDTILWPDSSFDAALSTSTIHHQQRAQIAQTIAEIWRVLKPDGLFLADFPCTDTFDYALMRSKVAAGEIVEVEPNTFVDQRPNSDDFDGFLPHHYCDEADLRDLLASFEVIKLRADLHPAPPEWGGLTGKWVASVRKSLPG